MLTFVPANAQHIGMRKEQQDSFAFSDPDNREFVSHGGLLGVVADGMGGLAGGAEASRAAVGAFHAAYGRKARSESIQAAMNRSLMEANAAVVQVARRLSAQEGTGTTLAAIVLHGTSLYWICAGDSRIYLLRSGELARVNADHNQRGYLLEQVAAGRLDRESAWNDPEGPHLTSYLGIPEIQRIDFSARPFPVIADDLVLVCTDGVYRALSEDEIKSAFARMAPAPACETLQKATLAKGHSHQDNLTMIAIQCRGAAVSQSAPAATAGSHRTLLAGALALEVLLAAGLTARLVTRPVNPQPADKPAKVAAPPSTDKQPPAQPAGHPESKSESKSEKKSESQPESAPAPTGKADQAPAATDKGAKGKEHEPSRRPHS